jgi:AraC family transcriptional regulator of arabinose operon
MIKIVDIGFGFTHVDSTFGIDRRHGTPDYLFLLFRSRVKVFFDEGSFIVEYPAVIIYPKNHKHKYAYADEPLVNDFIHFDGDPVGGPNGINEIDELLKILDIPVNTLIFIDDFQIISNLIWDLESEYRQPGAFKDHLLDAKIKVLLCKIACICHQEKNIPQSVNHHRKEFTNIRNRIYQLHGPDLSVSELAGQLYMSTSYFHHVYKILFNASPGQDMIRSRINYACVLLRSENISVAKVAEMCHYSNVEHFIRQFKQYMKCTPGEYRRRN